MEVEANLDAGWQLIHDEELHRMDVSPVDDLIDHDFFSALCVCMPETTKLEDGSLLIIHDSLDGRENFE